MVNPRRKNKPDIKDFQSTLKRRGINYFYHYSCQENLDSILKHGILSRKELNTRKIKPVELHGWGHKFREMEDMICLCFTPPQGMLRKYKHSFIAFAISSEIAGYEDVFFSPTNSAKDIMVTDDILSRESIDAFEELFHHDDGIYLKSPMAEILLKKQIYPTEIEIIIFPEWSIEACLWWIKGIIGIAPAVKIDSSLFCL